MLQQRRTIARVYLTLASIYIAYGMYSSSGLVGWLEQQQLQLSGSYSQHTTLLLAMFILFMPGALFAGGSLSPAATKAEVPHNPRRHGLLYLGLIVGTWIVGYGLRTWYQQRAEADASATYVELDAEASDAPAEHAALIGRVLENEAVILSETSRSSTARRRFWTPVVAPAWRPGEPVHYVMFSDTRPSDFTSPHPRGARVLARPGEMLPLPVSSEFSRRGVRLAEPLYVLDRIDSFNGQTLAFNAMQIDWMFWIGCTFMSLALALTGTVIASAQRREVDRGRGNAA